MLRSGFGSDLPMMVVHKPGGVSDGTCASEKPTTTPITTPFRTATPRLRRPASVLIEKEERHHRQSKTKTERTSAAGSMPSGAKEERECAGGAGGAGIGEEVGDEVGGAVGEGVGGEGGVVALMVGESVGAAVGCAVAGQ